MFCGDFDFFLLLYSIWFAKISSVFWASVLVKGFVG